MVGKPYTGAETEAVFRAICDIKAMANGPFYRFCWEEAVVLAAKYLEEAAGQPGEWTFLKCRDGFKVYTKMKNSDLESSLASVGWTKREIAILWKVPKRAPELLKARRLAACAKHHVNVDIDPPTPTKRRRTSKKANANPHTEEGANEEIHNQVGASDGSKNVRAKRPTARSLNYAERVESDDESDDDESDYDESDVKSDDDESDCDESDCDESDVKSADDESDDFEADFEAKEFDTTEEFAESQPRDKVTEESASALRSSTPQSSSSFTAFGSAALARNSAEDGHATPVKDSRGRADDDGPAPSRDKGKQLLEADNSIHQRTVVPRVSGATTTSAEPKLHAAAARASSSSSSPITPVVVVDGEVEVKAEPGSSQGRGSLANAHSNPGQADSATKEMFASIQSEIGKLKQLVKEHATPVKVRAPKRKRDDMVEGAARTSDAVWSPASCTSTQATQASGTPASPDPRTRDARALKRCLEPTTPDEARNSESEQHITSKVQEEEVQPRKRGRIADIVEQIARPEAVKTVATFVLVGLASVLTPGIPFAG